MNRKIKKYSNIIFDFDGTLFDTNQLHEKAFKKTLKKFGYDENLIHYKEIAGISTLNVFKSLFNSEQAILLTKIKQKFYRENIHEAKPLLSIKKLKELNSNFNLFIVSGGSRKSIYSILKFYEIPKIFKDIITSDETIKSKPHSDPYNLCIKRNKLDKLKCIAVEDSINGVISASSAGIDVFGVHNIDIKKHVLKYFNTINKIF
jgi:beta-phosphoglucomutase